MVENLGVHCSEKSIAYLKRKDNRHAFKKVDDSIAEINAIYSEMCEDFLIEDDKMMRVTRKRIIQGMDEKADNEEPNTEQKREGKGKPQGAFICNFFVVPEARLQLYDTKTEKYTQVGLSVKVYTRINKKVYKCVELDLLNETLANVRWIDPNFLDYDFYLYKDGLYPNLLRAIRLATRLLKKKNTKVIFSDEVGWVDKFYGLDKSGYFRYEQNGLLYRWKESENKKVEVNPRLLHAVVFLQAIQGLIQTSRFQQISDQPKLSSEFIGWADEAKWVIKYSYIKPHAQKAIKTIGKNFKIDNQLFGFLYLQDLLAIEGEVEGDAYGEMVFSKNFRPGTKFTSSNDRYFVLDKARMHEFLSVNQHILE